MGEMDKMLEALTRDLQQADAEIERLYGILDEAGVDYEREAGFKRPVTASAKRPVPATTPAGCDLLVYTVAGDGFTNPGPINRKVAV